MNILYISHLSGNLSGGPSNSVPAQVKAQSKYDNVFWWNLTKPILDTWIDTGVFHSVSDYPKNKIYCLPAPFNNPDLVVFEDFYYLDDVFLSFECYKRHIPYVIVPRGAFTHQGQSEKRIKKMIANTIGFHPMARHAYAIQYLTEQEYIDSGDKWNKRHFIEPNGINPAFIGDKSDKDPSIIGGTYIGRFDIFHKGLDLLCEAVSIIQGELRKANVVIALYGPEFNGQKATFISNVDKKGISDILVIKEGVFGKEKQSVLINSDFFIMTSRYEGMPMSMIEAMSYGLPCLASQGTNLSGIIKKASAGWTCDTSVSGIIDALRQLINDKEKLTLLGKQAYELSLEYSWDTIAKRTHMYFEKIKGA